jgi:hypothetical protein
MKTTLLALALATIPGIAAAQNAVPSDNRFLPPIEYDQPYQGHMVVIRGDKAQMVGLCPKTPMPITLGCAIHVGEGRGCIVVIANDEILKRTPWSYDMVWRHENGHCQNWGGDHRGARPATAENMANFPAKAEPPPTPSVVAMGDRMGVLPSMDVPLRGQWPSDLRRSQ